MLCNLCVKMAIVTDQVHSFMETLFPNGSAHLLQADGYDVMADQCMLDLLYQS